MGLRKASLVKDKLLGVTPVPFKAPGSYLFSWLLPWVYCKASQVKEGASFCVRVSAEKGPQVSAMLSWEQSSACSIPLLVQPALLHRSLWSIAPHENKFFYHV